MILILLVVLWQIARALLLRAKCLEDEEIYLFIKGRFENNSAVQRRIASHLGTCEKCREQMRMIQFGKELDEHLVEKNEPI